MASGQRNDRPRVAVSPAAATTDGRATTKPLDGRAASRNEAGCGRQWWPSWHTGLTGAAALVVSGVLAGMPAPASAQGQQIGVASAVVRDVTGNAGGTVRPLGVGENIFGDETIQTAARSNSQLLFRDETTLTIGPSSSVVLDRFVYDPDGQASTFAVRATRGALRFVSGSSQPSAYQLRTPVATIGVRGTILDLFIQPGIAIVVLSEGAADVCINGQCTGVTKPGTYVLVRSNGRFEGPLPWDGRLRSIIGTVSFPLYGWTLNLERGPRYVRETERLDDLDQIEARDRASFDGPPQVIDEPFEPPLWNPDGPTGVIGSPSDNR